MKFIYHNFEPYRIVKEWATMFEAVSVLDELSDNSFKRRMPRSIIMPTNKYTILEGEQAKQVENQIKTYKLEHL